MSSIPSKKDLKQLAKFNEPYCLSIYTPYIEPTGSSNPNKIVLKNLIRQARSELLATGLKLNLIDKTLKPIRALLEGQEFWPIRRESLAIFAHSKFFKYFHLPNKQIPRLLNIGQGFTLEPLQQLAKNNKSYVVLALGHNNVKLYKANRYEIKPINLKGFPASMYQALRIDELPRVIETHTVAPTEPGKASHSFHGQYNVSQTDKTMLVQFFRHINRRLHEFLRDQHLPLILAGVNYLLPIYQSVNTYPYLVGKGVASSPSSLDAKHLNKKAWKIISHWQDAHLSANHKTKTLK